MRLQIGGIDTSVIALWLGHVSVETTHIYLHADLELKEKALARPNQPTLRAATNHQTAFSPGSKPSDYADLTSPPTPTTSELHNNIDTIRRSA
jgi:hypothetical protein